MSETTGNPEGRPEAYAYEFPNMAYAISLHTAYLERGIFRRPKTVEERRLLLSWAEVDPAETERYHGTTYELTETAKLLLDWSESAEERIVEGHETGRPWGRESLLRLAFARLAGKMATGMEFLAVTGGEELAGIPTVDDALNLDDIYHFLGQPPGEPDAA